MHCCPRPGYTCHRRQRQGRPSPPEQHELRGVGHANVGWMRRHRGHAPFPMPHPREAAPWENGTKLRIYICTHHTADPDKATRERPPERYIGA